MLGLKLACLIPLFTVNVVTGFSWVLAGGTPLQSPGPLFFSSLVEGMPLTNPNPGFPAVPLDLS